MKRQQSYHMTPEEFRRRGKEVIDWIADYYESIERYPVLANVEPGAIRARLPQHPPLNGEPFERMIADMNDIILPGITHWQSPNFFAFFPANASGPAILGDLLSAGLGVQGMMWITSPACTELETHVLDWTAEMLGLPEKFTSKSLGGGVIQDTASSAALSAILAARERATSYASNDSGVSGKLIVYASTQAHSSIEKAVKIAGIGKNQLRLIEVDDAFAMSPEHLRRRIKEDRSQGYIPAIVCATVGTTSSLAIDPLPEIGRICKEENIWLHVDAAMAGTAAVCPEFRHIHNGLEYADSYCFNPHKWMFTNFDCDCFFVADRSALIRTFSIVPEYLRNQASDRGDVIDYRDWHIQLGRRFRSLKLWFVIRHYGVEGLRHHVRQHIEAASEFARAVQGSQNFELAAPQNLNLVCFRHKDGDDAGKKVLEGVNKSGKIYITHTVLNGRYTLRMCVGQTNTEARHVRAAWEIIEAEGKLNTVHR